MKPLPAQRTASGKPTGEAIPSLPAALAPSSGPYSTANRRATNGATASNVYPLLLLMSTAVAGLFCLLYITKPVIVREPAMAAPATPAKPAPPSPATAQPADLMPRRDALPGENQATVKPVPSDPRGALADAPVSSFFEETNLRIQHVLTAEAPGGHRDRIVLDVPVLYQSRQLRWTPDEVARARDLLVRLMDYQEKSRTLRAEGIGLLDAWNSLIEKSIPAAELRADSPTLPANQQDAADAPRPAGLITTDSIQLQPAGK